jgi:peptidoglycan/LPS O-acetylase OafA/YrhL
MKLFFAFLAKKYSITIPLMAIKVTRFHTMLIGVCGAILFYNSNKIYMKIATNKITQLLCWFCILLIVINRFQFASSVGSELVAIITVFIIAAQVSRKNYLINLENKLLNFIGKISYGIYVIHPLIIFYFSKIFCKFSSVNIINYLLVYVSIIVFTILLAYVSYEFFEKRFLNFKKKFAVVPSSNSLDKI